jgi:hypothetical protein
MARSKFRSLRLSDKDLDFLVETVSPGVIDKPKLLLHSRLEIFQMLTKIDIQDNLIENAPASPPHYQQVRHSDKPCGKFDYGQPGIV